MTDQIKPSLSERVRSALIDNPASTAQQLAAMCDATAIQTGKCLNEIAVRGGAIRLGKRYCPRTGRWMTYWRAIR
jgi:hypothetical protein